MSKQKPMTTREAHAACLCDECKSGGRCSHSCVESATCSVDCNKCYERNWFFGSPWSKTIPESFPCVHCGSVQTMESRGRM